MPHPREELSPEGDGPDGAPTEPNLEGVPADAGIDGDEPVVIAGEPAATEEELDPRRAYEVLEIRTPLEEFDAYGRARIETLAKLGEVDRADVTALALELGRRAIARVTGVPLGGRDGRTT